MPRKPLDWRDRRNGRLAVKAVGFLRLLPVVFLAHDFINALFDLLHFLYLVFQFVTMGPRFREMQVEGNKIILTFDNVGGGLTSDGKLEHFAIAGRDQKFVWADAVIEGDKVIVSSPSVRRPVAVRYGWANNPDNANLKNKEGLLASPFRTDNW